MILLPTIYYFSTGDVTTILKVQLLGVDSSTPIGYTITTIYHIAVVLSLVLLFVYFDGLYALYVFNVRLFSGLLRHQVEQLNVLLEDDEASKDMLRIKLTLRNIIKMNGEMIE